METDTTAAASSPASSTIGMKIDSIIAKLSDSFQTTIHTSTTTNFNIPYTYQAFIIICCLFAFIVLNSNDPSNTLSTNAKDQEQLQSLTKSYKTQSSSATRTSKTKEEQPQPKWHILKLLNILSVIGLLSSFGWFACNASTYLNDSQILLKFMGIWGAFLCYFFGFFGMSFIDVDEFEQRGGDGQQQKQKQQQQKVEENDEKSKLASHDPSKKPSKSLPIHPPAACTPVCSDNPPPSSPPSNTSSTSTNIQSLSDAEIANLVITNKIKDHQLEKLTNPHRAVQIRRLSFDMKLSTLAKPNTIQNLPYQNDLDYGRVYGANCETVIGYIPLPVGMVGPLTLNNQTVYFPMATTEGCLVASTNRGCKAISMGTGAISTVMRDGITRAPCVRMESAKDAALLKIWCEEYDNFVSLKQAFESTTSFGKLEKVDVTVAGRNAYIRLRCFSGDAMGMNMVSKGSLAVIDYLKNQFPSLVLVALSGNMCTDKKAAAVNWIEGRGKSVVVEATIPKDVVRTTLKTDVKTIVSVNVNKNLIGSAMAGAVGGFNAHAANIVTAIFLATGQDPAQNVESSNCITLMEETDDGDLWISCTMPSIEVGTVGGGTGLPAQSAGLKIIGCKGGGEIPGENAKQLAQVVASAVMAGELSLLAALAANTLVQAHMQHNRKPASKK